ncbi:MAG TPA: ABC transporter ATP-binding protein, partial [Actinomycetales bacterium]|nr:ABC transporter ATP-binding protein [Actinomycetales bacterium]
MTTALNLNRSGAHPASDLNTAIATTRDLVKKYGSSTTAVTALAGIDIEIGRGELTVIMGPSGSGKSTLMHCLAGLDTPTSGTIEIDGQEIHNLRQRQLTKLRRTKIGFIFQAFNLVPTLTAAENITLPLDLAHEKVDQDWFDEVIETVGLADRLKHRPAELSGGQQQRVACARALVARPAIVFADEPTGNLDSTAAVKVLQFLRDCVDQFDQSIVMVTHDPLAASYAHRV